MRGRTDIPCFLISSAYKPFVQSLGHLLGFKESEVYYTPLNLDQYFISESEREILKDLADEIINMPTPGLGKEPTGKAICLLLVPSPLGERGRCQGAE